MARVLVTNDDGVDSPGILALATVAHRHGHDVVIAAPSWDSNGASASLTAALADGRLILDRRSARRLPDVKIFAVEAAPAFIVRAASTGAFGPPPDVVLSGIESGRTPDMRRCIGPVGAALTGSTTGARVAFSIGVGRPIHWETATVAAAGVDRRRRRELVLNVNVPNVEPHELTAARPPGHGRRSAGRADGDGRGLRQAGLRGARGRAGARHRRRGSRRRRSQRHCSARRLRGGRLRRRGDADGGTAGQLTNR